MRKRADDDLASILSSAVTYCDGCNRVPSTAHVQTLDRLVAWAIRTNVLEIVPKKLARKGRAK